jgi:16S rRNA A1518/A1519 N6-dimethyltransferase RsmA/KsgA/DIM1 with predicted DNA glycosylase/AP lyase activity
MRRTAPAAGTVVLDLAAGRGAFTGDLLARECAVTAVDGAPQMIELLKDDHPADRQRLHQHAQRARPWHR